MGTETRGKRKGREHGQTKEEEKREGGSEERVGGATGGREQEACGWPRSKWTAEIARGGALMTEGRGAGI